jgi:hypothetical protein
LVLSLFVAHNDFNTHQEMGWKGVIPLRSSKSEVEKILGKPLKEECNNCTYQTDREKVFVAYSEVPCKGLTTGWNVPKDTVLHLAVYPQEGSPIPIPELRGEKSFYVSTGTFVLPEKGVAYTLEHPNGPVEMREVKQVLYMPRESDNNLRCDGFPPYHPVGSMYAPQSSFGDKAEATGFLDNLIVEMLNLNSAEWVAYTIVYVEKELSDSEYDKLFKKFENYVYKKRKASSEMLRLTKGGRRESFSIEVFILKKDQPPPMPSPDYSDVRAQM